VLTELEERCAGSDLRPPTAEPAVHTCGLEPISLHRIDTTHAPFCMRGV
jgi:hypothetical protein